MDLTINDGNGNMLFINSDNDHVDFCVIVKDDDEQFDFTIDSDDWKRLKSYIEQKINSNK